MATITLYGIWSPIKEQWLYFPTQGDAKVAHGYLSGINKNVPAITEFQVTKEEYDEKLKSMSRKRAPIRMRVLA